MNHHVDLCSEDRSERASAMHSINNDVNLISRNQQKLMDNNIDHHLRKMLLMKMVLLTLLQCLQAIQKLYSTISDQLNTSDWEKKFHTSLLQIFIVMMFVEKR
jgi:hypothetical protein